MSAFADLVSRFDAEYFTQIFVTSLGHLLWQGCFIFLLAKLLTISTSSSIAKYWVNQIASFCLFACLPLTFHYCASTGRHQSSPNALVTYSQVMEPTVVVEPQIEFARETPSIAKQPDRQSPAEHHETPALPAAVTPVVSLPKSFDTNWQVIVTMVYALGVLSMLFRLIIGIYGSQQITRRSVEVLDASLLNELKIRVARMGMRTLPALKTCSEISVPVVVGLFKPTILLPAAIISGIPTTQLGSILTHELVHLRRNDLMINLIQRVIECFTFFHPASWLLSREINRYREHACDDSVVQSGNSKMEYVESLLRMAEHSSLDDGQRRTLALSADGASPSEFRRRILRLLGEKEMNHRIKPLPALASLTAMVSLMVLSFGSAVMSADSADSFSNPLPVVGGEWPQWGGNSLRNNALEGSAPTSWSVKSGDNVKWIASLEDSSFFAPVVANGKVYAGTNGPPGEPEQARLLCFDLQTGRLIWSYDSPRLETGRVNDWPGLGMGSSPAVVEDALFFLSNRCEVVCLDADSGQVEWKTDLIEELDVSPCKMQTSSPTVVDGLVLVGTSHGISLGIDSFDPAAPSFSALDSKSGEVIWSDASPGKNVLHGQWSSPAYGVFDGVPQAVFAGGDGWLYGFDFRDIKNGNSNLLWKFDCNPKRSTWMIGGTGTRNNLLATPVIHDGLIYIGVGQNPEHGEGPGHLWCIDPTKRGDVSSELVVTDPGKERIAAGDILRVSIDQILPPKAAADSELNQGASDVGYPIVVLEDGAISLPLLKPIHVAGLTIDDARSSVVYAYRKANIFRNSEEINIRITRQNGRPSSRSDSVYKIQEKDQLSVFFKKPGNFPSKVTTAFTGDTHRLTVSRDGSIVVPKIGKLFVRGLTIDEARNRLKREYSASVKGSEDDIVMTIVEHHWNPNRTQQREQAAGPDDQVIANPNSAAIWHYVGNDLDKDGELSVEERFHRTACSVAIKDGLLFAGDHSGILHCLDAKSGDVHWTYDLLAACYSSPLIVGDYVYVGDEDGEVAIFKSSANRVLVTELDMRSSISGPLVSDSKRLYVPTRTALTVIVNGTSYSNATATAQLTRHAADLASSTNDVRQKQRENVLAAQILALEKSLSSLDEPSPQIQAALQSLRIRLQALRQE